MINPNIHDKRFKSALIGGLDKQEVYHYLYEVETAYNELLDGTEVLSNKNDELSSANETNLIKIHSLENEISHLEAELRALKIRNHQPDNDFIKEEPKKPEPVVEPPKTSMAVAPEESKPRTSMAVPPVESVLPNSVTPVSTPEPVVTPVAPNKTEEVEDVLLGEVEDNKNKAFRLGNDDDEDEGFDFVE